MYFFTLYWSIIRLLIKFSQFHVINFIHRNNTMHRTKFDYVSSFPSVDLYMICINVCFHIAGSFRKTLLWTCFSQSLLLEQCQLGRLERCGVSFPNEAMNILFDLLNFVFQTHFLWKLRNSFCFYSLTPQFTAHTVSPIAVFQIKSIYSLTGKKNVTTKKTIYIQLLCSYVI